jgi:hypothetical protein
MEGHLFMSIKERQRISTFGRVAGGDMNLAQASQQLGITRRHCRRVLRRYEQGGDAGLVHRSRGKPSTHQKDPALKAAVLDKCRAHYPDFGPTLASEKLVERHALKVHPETLRLWLIEDGQRVTRPSKSRHRTWRQRKAHFGEMVQMDGSVHDWFEGRGPRCFLMSMVDDATGDTLLLFSEEETTFAAMRLVEAWVQRYGIPASLYVDRKNVYVTDREQTPEEQLKGIPALTQFGRACHQLGVRIIEANSPQAKGRVERKHGVCQDRLVKDMRLEGISNIQEANKFLTSWTPGLNAKFAVAARDGTDLHRPLPKGLKMDAVFYTEYQRTLGADFTLRYMNRWFQIERQPELPKPRTRITLRFWPDGSMALLQNERKLAFHELEARPQLPHKEKKVHKPSIPPKPKEDHPWKRPKGVIINPKDAQKQAELIADQYLGYPFTNPDHTAQRAQGAIRIA